MTFYVGEQFRVAASATDYDGDVLVSTDAASVVVSIFDRDGTAIVTNQPMTWDTENSEWEYKWNTTGLDSGSYRAKVVFTGLDGGASWEWQRVRLNRNPF